MADAANTGPRRSERIAKRIGAANSTTGSIKSDKSTTSVQLRQKQVDLDVAEEISKLQTELIEFENRIELAEHEVKETMDMLDFDKDKLESATTEDLITSWKEEIDKVELDLKQKINNVAKMKIDFKMKKKTLELKQGLLLKKADLQKDIIAEEDELENNSQNLDDDVTSLDLDATDKAVAKWAETSDQKSETEVQLDESIKLTLSRLQQKQNNVAAEEIKLIEQQQQVKAQAERVAAEKKSAEEDAKLLQRFENLKVSITNDEPLANYKEMSSASQAVPPFIPPEPPKDKMDAFMSRQTMKQDLPHFDGNVEEWPIFISQYRLVTNACGLREDENLMRLQKSLKGKARECVRALLMSSSNVPKIIEVLERRFGDPRFILESLIRQVKIPSIKEGNLEDFLEFVDKVRNLSTTATAMKCQPYLTNPALIRDLVSRLPWSMQSSWAKFLVKQNRKFPDILDLTNFLEKESEGLERIYMPTMGMQPGPEVKKPPHEGKQQNNFRGGQREKGNRVLVVDNNDSARKPKEKKCFYCQANDHFVSQCPKFTRLDVDARWKWVKEKSVCFCCLVKGHILEKCFIKKTCSKDGCEKYHHHLLHNSAKPPREKKEVPKKEDEFPPGDEKIVTHATETNNEVSLLILPVKLYGPKGMITTIAMLDSGATVTLIDEKIAKDIGLEGRPKQLSYSGLHPTIYEKDSEVVQLEISNLREENIISLKNVRTSRNLPLPRRSVRRKLIEQWPHLIGLDIATYENSQPKILIGMDHPDLVIPMERRLGPGNAPGAACTELGWILYNRSKAELEENFSYFIRREEELEDLNQLVKHHFTTEALGVKILEEKPRSKEDKRGQEIMDATLRRVGDRFKIGLLWKEDDVRLPENKQAALNRLKQQEKKMTREELCDWGHESRWVNGPAFLQLDENEWPKEKVKVTQEEEDEFNLEIKKKFVEVVTEPPTPLIDTNKYSSWRKFIRTVAYIFRIKDYCLTPKKQRKFIGEITPMDIRLAEVWCWRQYQRESFPKELEALQKGKELPKHSRLLKLNVKLDSDGVMRLYGRIDKAVAVPVETRNPVLLDSKHPYTRLLIMHHHEKGGHHGKERVLNELRQQFHILKMRNAVKRAWMDCQKCKNDKAQPIMPEMGQLPAFRLESNNFPFNKTGLDYFGPIEITVGRKHEKRYGALFTCLSTRAVHVEIAASLNTDSCINAIRRFVARRGCPSDIYSDNGTNFVGANHELKKALKDLQQEKIETECCNKGIRWHFNPPLAPHMGGSWERLVKSIKIAFYASLKEIYPREEVLQTLMAEAEHIVNSHPLTHVPIDPEDPVALTPNHFLIGRTSNVQAPGVFEESDLCLRKQWRKAQRMTDNFWKRWIAEYLPTLLNRKKWHQKCAPIKEGDIVLEVSPALPRNSWPLGRIIKVYPGDDGQVRVVDYINANGNVFKRSVKNLCVLNVIRPGERNGAEGENMDLGESMVKV